MNVLIFIAVLVGLIVVHEFGHFIVAKRAGIRVDEFGIFFGPKLLEKRIGETNYTLRLFPIGGFVRIFGEDPHDFPAGTADYARAFFAKPLYVQAAVLVAGVTFNVLAAWVLFSAALMLGVPTEAGAVERGVLENPVLTIAGVLPHSPADEAALQPGDIIAGMMAGGDVLEELTPEAASAFIQEHTGGEIHISYERDSMAGEAAVTPAQNVLEGDEDRAVIGISMGLIGTWTLPPHLAVVEGFSRTIEMLGVVTVGIAAFLADAITLSADLSQVAGPVGIVSLVGDAAALGIVSLLLFSAIISLHLAVINLLPIPALDGGRLLFVAIEAIKGSPLRPSVVGAANMIGFALLILLMVAVTYNDILRLAA